MTRPIVRIHDLATNEVIDREMNDTEYDAINTFLYGTDSKLTDKTQLWLTCWGKFYSLI